MSSRIDVELTSERPDGTWTWRAAGARQPKGVLDGSLLPEKAKIGDVIRAEADFDIDGITVTAVLPPRSERREPQRLEILGPPPEEQRPPGRPDATRHPKGRGPERSRPPRPADGDRRSPGRDAERRRRPDQRPPRRETATRAPSTPVRPKPKKLRPGRTHRDAVLSDLPPEQHPIAVQVLRGGIPAVRTALAEQNAKARKEGLPEAPNNAVLAIAERLLPRLRVAEWLDRAEAALADADNLALRDLRSVVVSADDVARDPSTREAAARLREILERRTATEHQQWLADLSGSLEGGRVVRALRLSSRPPQPGDHLPPEVATRLAEAAGAAMTADAGSERWATVLDAVAYSAVRRNVTPAGVPPEPSEELLALVRKHAGRLPGIAEMFGVEPPAEGSGPKRGGESADRPPKHRATQRTGPPSEAASAPARPRRIPPPPATEAPVAGSPVAEPAPPTTSPADPPAGAAVPPAGAGPTTEPPTTEPPTTEAPTTEPPTTQAPTTEPSPGPVAQPAPPTTSPADPPAGAAVPPAGAGPTTEPPSTERPSPEASPAPDAAATEPSPAPSEEPAAEPDPGQVPAPSDAVAEPVIERDRPDRGDPGAASA